MNLKEEIRLNESKEIIGTKNKWKAAANRMGWNELVVLGTKEEKSKVTLIKDRVMGGGSLN